MIFYGGCSFSYFIEDIDISIPSIIQDDLGIEVDNKAYPGASNDYLLFYLIKLIRTEKISSKDLVILQYTEPARRFFWKKDRYPQDDFYDGVPSHWKYESYRSINSHSAKERDFHKLYQDYFLNPEFESDRDANLKFTAHHLLNARNIKTLFIRSEYSEPLSLYVNSNNFFELNLQYLLEKFPLDGDEKHLSLEGLQEASKVVIEFLKEKDLIPK